MKYVATLIETKQKQTQFSFFPLPQEVVSLYSLLYFYFQNPPSVCHHFPRPPPIFLEIGPFLPTFKTSPASASFRPGYTLILLREMLIFERKIVLKQHQEKK